MFDNDAWLDQVTEDIIEPERPIIDPHHHLWHVPELPYDIDALLADTASGHNIVKTVFMECSSSYREDGPEHLKCVGETDYVAERAAKSKAKDGAYIAGIISHADLTSDKLDEVLDAHEEAGKGLFRGIRHAGAWDSDPTALLIPPPAPENLYADPAFRAGVARLGERGLSYDTWHYHHQNIAFRDLALAVPNTTLVLDHFGTPLGVGRFAGKQDKVFEGWKDDIAAIAKCPNVVAKIGGLAMPDNGFPWFGRDKPPTSDEFVEAQARYYHHTIECFGPERSMFESNFPVDRLSISYPVLWNGLKKIASRYNADDQHSMFYGTAERIYHL